MTSLCDAPITAVSEAPSSAARSDGDGTASMGKPVTSTLPFSTAAAPPAPPT